MGFKDIFKKSFLEGFANTPIGARTTVVALGVTCAIALYIFFVYRILTRKTFYSKSFNISLAAIAVITSAIILTIQSSVVVSLGMVGALSIVRFRTAIKEPMDLIFLFWAISVGIICGAGLAEIAVILSVFVTVLIIVLEKLPVAKAPMVLVINARGIENKEDIMKTVNNYAKHCSIKSQNITSTTMDMIIELRTNNDTELLENLMKTNGVVSTSLLRHDGEVTF